MIIHISKLDAALRQLETAIHLFFHDGDPVSIHGLTSAAHEVLEAICKKQGINSVIMGGIEKFVLKERQKEVKIKLSEVKNFIKHADRDAEAIVEFNPETTQYFIWDACRLYKLLTTTYTLDMHVYVTWMSMTYPDLFINPDIAAQFTAAKSVFNPLNKIKFYSDVLAGYNIILNTKPVVPRN